MNFQCCGVTVLVCSASGFTGVLSLSASFLILIGDLLKIFFMDRSFVTKILLSLL
jgi:hypothetical protein